MSTSDVNEDMEQAQVEEVEFELPALPHDQVVDVRSQSLGSVSTIASDPDIEEMEGEEEEEQHHAHHMVFLDDWDSDYEDSEGSPSVFCVVCYDEGAIPRRACCGIHVCEVCLIQFVTTRVEQGLPIMHCPCPECDEPIPRDEVKALLPTHLVSKYEQFIVDTEGKPGVKTCPRCSFVLHWNEYQKTGSNVVSSSSEARKTKKSSSDKHKVVCPACDLLWCFSCHSPWHERLSCRDFRKGQKQFKKWVKGKQNGIANAQKCPKCNVCIQRTTGCDHMTCSRCHCEFCYRCGKRMISMGWVGDHYSRYSVLGCKYNYKPDKPVQRKLTRGAIFSGTVAATPVVAGLVVGVAGAVIAAAPVLLSAYGIYRLQRKIRRR